MPLLRRGPLTIDAVAGHTSPGNWALSPRGDQVAFTRETGEAQLISRMPVSGGWPVRITPELKRYGRPSWSPDGRRLATVADKALYRMTDTGAEVVRLFEHPAGMSEPAWSPDGATIAFRSRERGWDQIWTIGIDGGAAHRLTTLPADNADLQWSPGARFIAYTSIRDDLHRRDLYTVDATTGAERNLTAGTPGFNLAPAWAPNGGRLAFLSERDGFLHVYVLHVASGEVRQLTEGPWEDGGLHGQAPRHLCWSSDGTRLAFLRNRDGCFDVMLIQVDGGGPRRISSGDGNWGIVGWLPDGASLLASFDSPVQPPDLWRLTADGDVPEQLTFSAGGFPPSELVTPERAAYTARDGRTIAGLLYRPRGFDGRRPALVVPHGGPSSQFATAWRPIFQIFAQQGYAVFGPDFRGSTGYGREFREANFGEWGNADLWDVVDAAGYLRGLNWIDADRIGVYGGSYGGYMVLCALARSPETFRCGVDLFGDSEIAESYRHGDRVGRLDLHRQMGGPDNAAEAYRRGSPIYQAERVEAPLLILHGRDDKRVVPLMSERMVEALTIEGKFFEQHFYEGEGHGFRRPANKKDSLERTLRFLKRHLEGETAEE
ncbi:MAG: S9 family peptidase [Dehalococcoidia bacterium]